MAPTNAAKAANTGKKCKSITSASTSVPKKTKTNSSASVSRRATVLTDEEDEERLARKGIDTVIEEDLDGNLSERNVDRTEDDKSEPETPDEDEEAELSRYFLNS